MKKQQTKGVEVLTTAQQPAPQDMPLPPPVPATFRVRETSHAVSGPLAGRRVAILDNGTVVGCANTSIRHDDIVTVGDDGEAVLVYVMAHDTLSIDELRRELADPANSILGIAAASAEPGQVHPEPDPDVAVAVRAIEAGRKPADMPELARARARLIPLYSIELAQQLPEVESGEAATLTGGDPREIQAFKDVDGRTMLVVLTADGLAKMAKVPA